MERDPSDVPGLVYDLERLALAGGEHDLPERDPPYGIEPAIVVADLEPAARELRIPPDSAQ
jgi:hypothetical protein